MFLMRALDCRKDMGQLVPSIVQDAEMGAGPQRGGSQAGQLRCRGSDCGRKPLGLGRWLPQDGQVKTQQH